MHGRPEGARHLVVPDPGDRRRQRYRVSEERGELTEEGLRHLVAEMGVSQVVYGTDIPFTWPDTLDVILNASFLNIAEKEQILSGNLMTLLRLT